MPALNSARNKSFFLPIKIEEEVTDKGIVSILGSATQVPQPAAAATFRRTLSADMSSKKWLAQNGFNKSPTMKKIASSEQLSFISLLDSSSSSSSDEESDVKNQKQDDVWSSIMSQNKPQELPPPYVHPLLKKSSSSLSEKSLKICTESLGSETGSDGLSWNMSEDINVFDKVEESSQPQQQEKESIFQGNIHSEEMPQFAKYNYSADSNKKLRTKSFPPPLPLLAHNSSSEGPCLHMHSHRENGRLVLEAVTLPSSKKLRAQREDGRLLLTLISHYDEVVVLDQRGYRAEEQESEKVFDIFEEEHEIQEEEDDDNEMTEETEEKLNVIQNRGIVIKQEVPEKARGLMNVHRSALMMKKLMGLENQKPTWSHKFNYPPAKVVEFDVADNQVPQSLPPRPHTARPIADRPVAAAGSFNAYEYFWRTKPASVGSKKPPTHPCSPFKDNTTNRVIMSNNKPIKGGYGQQELVALRNCKETRRSLLSWESYCIATS